VTDAENPIHLIGIRASTDYRTDDVHANLAKAWLDDHFADHANPLAYWD
jgi:hypothetical protein